MLKGKICPKERVKPCRGARGAKAVSDAPKRLRRSRCERWLLARAQRSPCSLQRGRGRGQPHARVHGWVLKCWALALQLPAGCWMLSSGVSKERVCLARSPAPLGLGCPDATAEVITPARFQSHLLFLLNKKVPWFTLEIPKFALTHPKNQLFGKPGQPWM